MRLKTVAVDRDGQKVIINESDFDPGRDRKWTEEKSAPEPKDEKDELIAQLSELGVDADRRMSVKNLKARLDEALQ